MIENFTMADLNANITPGQGYQVGSPQVEWLFGVLEGLDEGQRIQFMQFVTGSTALPVGGLAGLSPRLSVAKRLGADADRVLPTVSTCNGYLKLPEYSSREILRERLLLAIQEGRHGFHLA
jgi:E3 ubiquitin-protein ligase TRIP12